MAFDHLPADLREGIEKYEAAKAAGEITFDEKGEPWYPEKAEADRQLQAWALANARMQFLMAGL